MIIIRINGGLGNQMLEYAFGRAVAKATGKTVKYDCRSYGKKGKVSRRIRLIKEYIQCRLRGQPWGEYRPTLRLLDLEDFALDLPEATRREIVASAGGMPGTPDCRNFFSTKDVSPSNLASCRDGYYDSILNVSCLKSIRDELSSLFQPKRKPPKALRPKPGAVCIHVRRGDFTRPAQTQCYGLCSPDYFRAAADFLRGKLPPPLSFYVFSDDVGWCRSNLALPEGTVYMDSITHASPALTLNLMRRCRHFILSNSTFSIWAVLLGRSDSSCVVAPHPWFAQMKDWDPGIDPCIWLDQQTGALVRQTGN
jgi:hypothetical protein